MSYNVNVLNVKVGIFFGTMEQHFHFEFPKCMGDAHNVIINLKGKQVSFLAPCLSVTRLLQRK